MIKNLARIKVDVFQTFLLEENKTLRKSLNREQFHQKLHKHHRRFRNRKKSKR